MEDAKVLAAQNGIVFKDKIMRGEIGYNIIKVAQGKTKFDMIVMGSRGRSSTKEMFFWKCIKLCHPYIKNSSADCKIIFLKTPVF